MTTFYDPMVTAYFERLSATAFRAADAVPFGVSGQSLTVRPVASRG